MISRQVIQLPSLTSFLSTKNIMSSLLTGSKRIPKTILLTILNICNLAEQQMNNPLQNVSLLYLIRRIGLFTRGFVCIGENYLRFGQVHYSEDLAGLTGIISMRRKAG